MRIEFSKLSQVNRAVLILQVLKLDMGGIIVISKMKNWDFAVYFFQNVQGGKANVVLLSLADCQWAV